MNFLNITLYQYYALVMIIYIYQLIFKFTLKNIDYTSAEKNGPAIFLYN